MSWTANAQNTTVYQENFESYTPSSGLHYTLPTGWTKATSSSAVGVQNNATQVHNGSKSFGFNRAQSINNQYLSIIALPEIEVVTGTATLSFWSKAEMNDNRCGNFEVGYITDVTNPASFVSLRSYSYANYLSYSLVEVHLSAMPSNARIAFRHHPNEINYKWYIDDVIVNAQLPCCPAPTVAAPILTQGNGTVTTLRWTENGTATAWVLHYGTDPSFIEGSYQTMTEGFTVSGSTVTAQLSGLTPEQTYYARLQAICEGCGNSEWVGFNSFKPTNAFDLPAINNGTYTSQYIPINGNYCDYGNRCQFIIPAESLTELTDGKIAKLTFYSSNTVSKTFAGTEFRIYMKEVDYSTFENTTFIDWNSLTEVYEGSLNWSGTKWVFEFDDAHRFTYRGSNLLIGFYQTSYTSDFNSISWLGTYQTGRTALTQNANSTHNYNGEDGTYVYFLPKTTFSYFAPNFPRPKNLTFSNPTTDGITASWTAPDAGATAYQYQYSTDGGETWSVLTSTSTTSVTLSGLPYPDYTYTFRVKAIYSDGESLFTSNTFVTEALCPVPEGIAVATTAHTATLSWNMVEGAAYQCALALAGETAYNWDNIPANNTFTGLEAETDYVIYLRRDCTASEYGYSDPTSIAFRTDEACPAPTGVYVTYNGGTSAEITWTGNAEAYILEVNGEEISGPQVTSPYTLSVAYASTYTVGVKADCMEEGESNITYANTFSTDLCPAEDQCAINFTLTDAYGDGWGADENFRPHIRVVDAETNTLIQDLTLTQGASFSGSFDVCVGRTINFMWVNADINTYAYECGFVFTDINGNTICEHTGCYYSNYCNAPTEGVIASYTVNCDINACTLPKDFQASFGTNTATVSWTDNGTATSWTVFHKKATDTDYSNPVTVNNTTHTFSDLDAGTTYDVLIVSGCDDTKTLTGSFTTDCEATTITIDQPFTEGFENWIADSLYYTTNFSNGIYPDCWRSYTEGFIYPHIINYGNCLYIHEGSATMCFRGDANTSSYLALPSFNNLSTLAVSFWMQTEHASIGTLSLGYITEGDVNFNTYHEIETYNNSTVMVQRCTYLGLYAIPENATHLVFKWRYDGNFSYSACIDDVAVQVINKVFTGTEGNDWHTVANWTPEGMPTLEENVFIQADATIADEAEAKLVAVGSDRTLTIADGGKLKTDNDVIATMKKNIIGYGANYTPEENANANYYLIANPQAETLHDHGSSLTPNISTTGLRTGTFDLYRWDYTASDDLEWRNYKVDRFNLDNGKGYLYANQDNVELTFTGTLKANNVDEEMEPEYDATLYDFNGWNLFGNPFVCDVFINDASSNDIAFYRMNTYGNGFIAATGAIHPMEGVFVQATEADQSFKFSRTPMEGKSKLNIQLNATSALRQAQEPADRAIVRFGEGNTLEKFSFNEGSTTIYVPMEGKDYAVVNAGETGELPLCFKNEKNGSYTLSFTAEEVSFGYLHLIDNKTGADVDLLALQQAQGAASYTFEALTTDYASRFRLVFATGSSTGSEDDVFAFINAAGRLMLFGIEGEATLQVIDVLGHLMSSETINGNCEHSLNVVPGMYILRLIDNHGVKVQKIIVR